MWQTAGEGKERERGSKPCIPYGAWGAKGREIIQENHVEKERNEKISQ